MRITLDIDDDLLQAAKELARRQRKTAGAVILELAREALTASPGAVRKPKAAHGFRPFPTRGGLVTDDTIDKLRNDDAL